MSNNIGRPPVNSPYKVQRQPGESAAGNAFDASWQAEQTAPHSFVGIKATAKVAVNSRAVQITIYQLIDGRKNQIEVIGAPIVNGKIEAKWCAKPFKPGNFEEGVYHFVVSTGAFKGETVRPLLIRSAVNTNQSSFSAASPKPKVHF